MPLTGLYFLPDAPSPITLQSLIDRLTKTYSPTPLQRWTLDHRLFRSTTTSSSTTSPSDRPPPPRFLQVLSLSYHPNKSYVCISSSPPPPQTTSSSTATATPPPPTIIAVPSPSSTEELIQLLTLKMGPLWTSRQTLVVSGGASFEMEDMRVRIGEVKQGGSGVGTGGGPGAGGSQIGRGVAVEVEVGIERGGREEDGGEDDEEDVQEETEDKGKLEEVDWVAGEEAIRAIWEGLGLSGGRAFIKVEGVDGVETGLVGGLQWCELLRLRG
ncbi:MAG: hypothetical protein M1833_003556 [Piccolia ochrophora]|nr:MAG: hypothetical protein M1833_003556 [Piccolia ochrophora]